MILVLLGTQNLSFKRLLDALQIQIDKGNIKDKVIVQAGSTKYQSKDMEIFDLIAIEKLSKLVKEADLIITHGGVGSIMEGIKHHKKIIAVPRLKRYNEHVNDHQLQIIKEFSDLGYLKSLYDLDEFDSVLNDLKTFKPLKYKSNNSKLINLIDEYIENIK